MSPNISIDRDVGELLFRVNDSYFKLLFIYLVAKITRSTNELVFLSIFKNVGLH